MFLCIYYSSVGFIHYIGQTITAQQLELLTFEDKNFNSYYVRSCWKSIFEILCNRMVI